MMRLALLLALLPLAIAREKGEVWAVLMAGSNTWSNYRHQADVLHAAQVLKQQGVPDSNIVTMVYDDLALSASNPVKGTVINKPGGDDVYAGVELDYTGTSVTAANFYAVLLGQSNATKGGSGKVLGSGKDDKVFIYFSDHGGSGLICAPVGDYIYADELNVVLKRMYAQGMYSQLTFYLEACESGSMFEGLLSDNIGVYAVTAANAVESSWAAYCPGMSPAPPAGFNTCLGDLFSVAFLEDLEVSDLSHESLQEQFEITKARTANPVDPAEGSHALQYGDLSFTTEPVGEFVGAAEKAISRAVAPPAFDAGNQLAQREADLLHFRAALAAALPGTPEHTAAEEALSFELSQRQAIKYAFDSLAASLVQRANIPFSPAEMLNARPPASKPAVSDWSCYRAAINAFTSTCGPLPQTALQYFRLFANACDAGVNAQVIGKHAGDACTAAGLPLAR